MTSKEAYNYLLGLLELEDDIRWPLVKESMDKFKELVDQQSNPTLSECIKEWEDDGFEFNKIFCYELINEKKNVGIYFDNEPIGIFCNIEGHVTSKQLIRLIKTFKALGWEVEDETK